MWSRRQHRLQSRTHHVDLPSYDLPDVSSTRCSGDIPVASDDAASGVADISVAGRELTIVTGCRRSRFRLDTDGRTPRRGPLGIDISGTRFFRSLWAMNILIVHDRSRGFLELLCNPGARHSYVRSEPRDPGGR